MGCPINIIMGPMLSCMWAALERCGAFQIGGGLGIQAIKRMNKTFHSKWLWWEEEGGLS